MSKRIYFKNFKKVNFIYPKNCLPLWIKNFLYKKNQGILSDIITGTSFNLTNTVARKFNIFEIQGNTEQVQLTGKNLLEPLFDSKTKDGITIEFTEDGMKVSGNSTSQYQYFTIFEKELPAGSYVINGIEGSSFSSYILAVYKNNENIGYVSSNNFTFTLTEPTTIKFYFYPYATDYSTPKIFKYQLEAGTTATSYEPYCGGTASPNPEFPQPIYNVTGDVNVKIQNKDGTKEQNLPFTLGTQRLYKEDYLADDGIKHKCKRIVLDGTEDYATNASQNTQNTFYITCTSFDDILGDYLDTLYCTICTQGEVYSKDVANKINIYPNQAQRKLRFRIDINTISSIEAWTQYLEEQYQNGTPVIIEYNLKEEAEETTPYTETQQAQYNAIKELYTYEGTTNIEGTSSEISPILKIQYYEKEQ